MLKAELKNKIEECFKLFPGIARIALDVSDEYDDQGSYYPYVDFTVKSNGGDEQEAFEAEDWLADNIKRDPAMHRDLYEGKVFNRKEPT